MSKRMIKTAALILLAALFFLSSALGESYEATTMRLLRYDGSVEILDASGNARFVMENARFNSGESMQTGSASSASVGLDSTKIVTLDAETQVDFAKEAREELKSELWTRLIPCGLENESRKCFRFRGFSGQAHIRSKESEHRGPVGKSPVHTFQGIGSSHWERLKPDGRGLERD